MSAAALETIETVEAKFRRLAERWKAETAYLSSTTKMVSHPAYREIIGIGEASIPLLLKELAREPDFWFDALRELTGADPVAAEHRGRIKEMAADWLRWGRERG